MTVKYFRGRFFFLSNFYPTPIILDGIKYPTLEHAFQAAKTLDLEERMEILACPTPGRAKRAGKRVTQRPGWLNRRIDVMTSLVSQKFQRNTKLGQLLLSTGEKELIEGNNYKDTFWGIFKGRGENNLGKILMEVRATLRKK